LRASIAICREAPLRATNDVSEECRGANCQLVGKRYIYLWIRTHDGIRCVWFCTSGARIRGLADVVKKRKGANRDFKNSVVFGAVVVLAAMALGAAPVEWLIADVPRLGAVKIVENGAVVPNYGFPLWLYAWRVAVLLTVVFFAAYVSTFFVKSDVRMRGLLISLSAAIAVFHYLSLFSMGANIRIFPLLYTISIYGKDQIYIDIGQIFIIYIIYNIYRLKSENIL